MPYPPGLRSAAVYEEELHKNHQFILEFAKKFTKIFQKTQAIEDNIKTIFKRFETYSGDISELKLSFHNRIAAIEKSISCLRSNAKQRASRFGKDINLNGIDGVVPTRSRTAMRTSLSGFKRPVMPKLTELDGIEEPSGENDSKINLKLKITEDRIITEDEDDATSRYEHNYSNLSLKMILANHDFQATVKRLIDQKTESLEKQVNFNQIISGQTKEELEDLKKIIDDLKVSNSQSILTNRINELCLANIQTALKKTTIQLTNKHCIKINEAIDEHINTSHSSDPFASLSAKIDQLQYSFQAKCRSFSDDIQTVVDQSLQTFAHKEETKKVLILFDIRTRKLELMLRGQMKGEHSNQRQGVHGMDGGTIRVIGVNAFHEKSPQQQQLNLDSHYHPQPQGRQLVVKSSQNSGRIIHSSSSYRPRSPEPFRNHRKPTTSLDSAPAEPKGKAGGVSNSQLHSLVNESLSYCLPKKEIGLLNGFSKAKRSRNSLKSLNSRKNSLTASEKKTIHLSTQKDDSIGNNTPI